MYFDFVERYYVLFMVETLYGRQEKSHKIINCGGEKDTTFYSSHDSCMGNMKKYTRYNWWWTEERYYVYILVYDSCMGDNYQP